MIKNILFWLLCLLAELLALLAFIFAFLWGAMVAAAHRGYPLGYAGGVEVKQVDDGD